MRLSDLIGARVTDADGRDLGVVHDVELVADGPPSGAFGPALRISHLLVGSGSVGARLGLDRDEMRGPWLLKTLLGRHTVRRVEWTDIELQDDRVVRVARAL